MEGVGQEVQEEWYMKILDVGVADKTENGTDS